MRVVHDVTETLNLESKSDPRPCYIVWVPTLDARIKCTASLYNFNVRFTGPGFSNRGGNGEVRVAWISITPSPAARWGDLYFYSAYNIHDNTTNQALLTSTADHMYTPHIGNFLPRTYALFTLVYATFTSHIGSLRSKSQPFPSVIERTKE